jgi:hypothetical protein
MLGLTTESAKSIILIVAGVPALVLCGWVVVAYGVETGEWVRSILFGAAMPMVVFVDWIRLRARGGEARLAADRLFVPFVIAVAAMAWMVSEVRNCP